MREATSARSADPAAIPASASPDTSLDEGPAPVLSIVITSWNRPDLLGTCLAGFAAQRLEQHLWEVIVVDDGSEPSLEPVAAPYAETMPLRYLRVGHGGLAAARNAGIAAARGAVIVPYDDDNAPHPDCLLEHLRFHTEHPAVGHAMLAGQEWAPWLDVTPLMHYVTEVDPRLWCYTGLQAGQELPFGYLWGGCSSYKKALVETAGGFAERFSFGYEDTEAEVRMRAFGLQVFYRPQARNYACRAITFEEFCHRSERQGNSLVHFRALHPSKPEVRSYTAYDDPFERLAHLEPIMSAVPEILPPLLEEGWNLPQEAPEGEASLEQAHLLFRAAFDYHTARGIAAALRTLEAEPERCGSVLVIANELPTFDRASGAYRLFEIVRLLREAGNHVTFLARGAAGEFPPASYIHALLELGVEVLPVDPERYGEHIGRHVDLPRLDLDGVLRARRWDYVYVYFYEVAEQYLEAIRRCAPSARLIVDSVDVHFLRERRQAELAGDEGLRLRAESTRRRELEVYRSADAVVVVTEDDRDVLLQEDPELRVSVIPNIHPSDGEATAPEGRRDLLFVGGFPHAPNVDAVAWFHAEVWPLVAPRLPDARLHLVGDRPPQSVLALASERVLVPGYVEDLDPYLAGARISIAPLRYGAGMKGKVGQALAAGLPVVATSVAAEGMGLEHGVHALVADEARGFADEIVRLYGDDELWRSLSAAGRTLLDSRYSPAVVAPLIAGALDSIPLPTVLAMADEIAADPALLQDFAATAERGTAHRLVVYGVGYEPARLNSMLEQAGAQAGVDFDDFDIVGFAAADDLDAPALAERSAAILTRGIDVPGVFDPVPRLHELRRAA